MRKTFCLADAAKATANYVLPHLAAFDTRHDAAGWHPRLVGPLERLRESVRVEEGGGGMCHVVTELLMMERGWGRLGVSYLARDGGVICAGHYVSLLPDGSLLDPTADQFGEGHSVRRLKPDDPEYGRYRPEFDEDFNPRVRPSELSEFFWTGQYDYVVECRLRTRRGHAWWLQDVRAYLAYLARQVELGAPYFEDHLKSVRRRARCVA